MMQPVMIENALSSLEKAFDDYDKGKLERASFNLLAAQTRALISIAIDLNALSHAMSFTDGKMNGGTFDIRIRE